ncbi:hypothetical protein CRG98_017707 [Punica granatum]|uniref:Uncharacterized protein n=1 Tax=Punica granatum TaxID=22663 RepID=A0A2I0K006_PUNGR|nr:hypothetical protein CRG98_017707 [Punica granatum]
MGMGEAAMSWPWVPRVVRTIWVDPITLGANDHHGHLEGSLGYPGPLTLPQNSIVNLRGDVQPDLCQSGLFSVPVGSVAPVQKHDNIEIGMGYLFRRRFICIALLIPTGEFLSS